MTAMPFALSAPAGPLVAVAPFENAAGRKEHEPLVRAVEELICARLSRAARLVERRRLEAILREQRLALGWAGPEGAALKAGRLLAANYVVLGSVAVMGRKVVIAARAVEVRTGRVVGASKAAGGIERIAALAGRVGDELAGVLRRTGPPPKGLKVEKAPDYHVHWLEGLGLFYMGQYVRAIAKLTKAVRLEPRRPEIRLFLAKAYLAAGLRGHAEVELRRVARKFPGTREAKEAKALLESLRRRKGR